MTIVTKFQIVCNFVGPALFCCPYYIIIALSLLVLAI